MNSGFRGFEFCTLLTSCVRVFQGNGTSRISLSPFNCQEIYFKELTHALVRPGKFEICRASWQAGDSGKSWCCSLESEGWKFRQAFCRNLEAEVSLWETSVFEYLLLRPSTD